MVPLDVTLVGRRIGVVGGILDESCVEAFHLMSVSYGGVSRKSGCGTTMPRDLKGGS